VGDDKVSLVIRQPSFAKRLEMTGLVYWVSLIVWNVSEQGIPQKP